jgi:hypothetical protein
MSILTALPRHAARVKVHKPRVIIDKILCIADVLWDKPANDVVYLLMLWVWLKVDSVAMFSKDTLLTQVSEFTFSL